MIIDRLEKSVAGEIELSPTQVQSAKILLDKSISNAQTDLNVSGTVNVTWPEPKNKLDEWVSAAPSVHRIQGER
jgi:hypothetical protein